MTSPLCDALAETLAREKADALFSLSLATMADIAQMDALNAAVISELPGGGMFMRQEPDFFAQIMGMGGAAILAWQGEALISYAIAAPVAEGFPIFAERPGCIGLLFGTAVARHVRGRGLQTRMIDLRCDALRASGCEAVQATVAPSNHASLDNLLASGFEVIALRALLDGHPRFVVQRSLIRPPAPQDDAAQPLSLPPDGALADHRAALAKGARGTRLVYAPAPALLYRSPPEITP